MIIVNKIMEHAGRIHACTSPPNVSLTFESQSHLLIPLRRQLLQSSELISLQTKAIQHIQVRCDGDICEKVGQSILVGVLVVNLGCTDGMTGRGEDLADLDEGLIDGAAELVFVESVGRRGVARWRSHGGDR